MINLYRSVMVHPKITLFLKEKIRYFCKTKLVSWPVTMNQDTSSYQMQTIEDLEGNPVQLVGEDL